MKRVLLMLVVAAFTLASCKKDKNESKLEGRWDLTKSYYVTKVNGQVQNERTDNYPVGDSYIVFKGNSYTVYDDGEVDDKGTFSATDDSITMTDEDGEVETVPVRWNSGNELVVIFEDSETIEGTAYSYRYEDTYKRN